MSALNDLKEELIKQKKVIEKMYGTVNISNTNPSPSEITKGIESIPSVDLSFSNATEEDVKQGKTFYSGSPELRTGTAVFDPNSTNVIFMATEEQVDTEEEYFFTIPSYLNKVSKYKFYKNSNHISIYFTDEIESIDEYAFYRTPNFKFSNFNTMTKLTTLGNYAFSTSSCEGIDIGQIPHTVKTIGQYCFYQTEIENINFRFPNSLTSIGLYAFMAANRLYQKSLDLSNYKLPAIYGNCFYYHCFDCDFTAPATLKSLNAYCFYNGGFHAVYIPSTLITLEGYCMGGTSSHALESFYLKKVVFESETPPTFGTKVFATQNYTNGMKIYVPDNAVEAYKAVSNLQYCVDAILPMSQMT